MRLLYLYPEEWTGRRAREIHTLQTCLAMADTGLDVTLLTAGGFDLAAQLKAVGRPEKPASFRTAAISRRAGPLKSARFFAGRFAEWLRGEKPFERGYVIHLKAAKMLFDAGIPYGWEAHEIFAETPAPGSARERELSQLEKDAVALARVRVATSQALADALNQRFFQRVGPLPFAIVPHGGESPLARSVADPAGPFVYSGSIADWKGLNLILTAVAANRERLRVIGGTREEWQSLLARVAVEEKFFDWRPRVALSELPRHLEGCRAGLIPTLPQTPTGHYSCPMKLYDYARCGLPVVAHGLASFDSLDLGAWCRLVEPSADAWKAALSQPPSGGGEILEWARLHTWARRGERLAELLTA